MRQAIFFSLPKQQKVEEAAVKEWETKTRFAEASAKKLEVSSIVVQL